jgi:hypothetical protein
MPKKISAGAAKLPKASKPAKPLKTEPWKNMSTAALSDLLRHSAQFSGKTVNSNVDALGVRVTIENHLPLPYAAVTTFPDPGVVCCDYLRGAGDAGVMKHVAAVLEGRVAEAFTGVGDGQVEMVREALSILDSPAEIGTGRVNPRLRQVLLPAAAGSYVAVTPLHSAGFSEILRTRLEAERALSDAAPKSQPIRRRKMAFLGFGGANPQNVGRYVRSMQRVPVFSPPRADAELRAAWAIHFNGVDMAPERPALDAYARWRHEWKKTRDTSLATREREAELIVAIAQSVLERAAAATTLLDEHIDSLGSRTCEELASLQRALLDPVLRTKTWREAMAVRILQIIAAHEFHVGDRRATVGSDDDLVGYASIVEGVLR